MLEVKNVSFGYGQQDIIKDVSLKIAPNTFNTIIGQNGSGKSTLLMLLSRIHHLKKGTILLNDKDINSYSTKDFAKEIAVVHQKNHVTSDLDVKTIVGYGRLPYLKYHQRLSATDYQIIDWALDVTKLSDLKDTLFDNLSGGQQQRVWIAMALAQKTPILLLDEPTTYLDVKYQIEILNLLKDIQKSLKITIIMVHHDINQAIHYSDEIIAIKDGKIVASGKPDEIIQQDLLEKIYDYHLSLITYKQQKIVLNYK